MTAGQLRTTVAIGPGMDQQGVARSLEAGGQGVHAGGIVTLDRNALSALEALQDDALVIALAHESDEALALIRGAVEQRASRPVLVMFAGEPNGFTRKVFAAGADDLLVVDGSETAVGPRVVFALEKAMARRAMSGGTAGGGALAPSKVISVLGPKGGTGKTTVAANLATGLARSGKSVAALDLDLQFGDLGLVMGLTPERTIFDLATAGGGLDADKLEAYLSTTGEGVRILMAPIRPDQADAVTVDLIRAVIGVLRGMFDAVVVDTRPGLSHEVIAAIDESTHLCMVGSLDAPSLKNTRLALHALELMGVEAEKVQVVLNRADTKAGVSLDDAEAVLGRLPDLLVPTDRAIVAAVNQGRPAMLARGSDGGRALAALSGLYGSSVAASAVESSKRTSLFARKKSEPREKRERKSILRLPSLELPFRRRATVADDASAVLLAPPPMVPVPAPAAPAPAAAAMPEPAPVPQPAPPVPDPVAVAAPQPVPVAVAPVAVVQPEPVPVPVPVPAAPPTSSWQPVPAAPVTVAAPELPTIPAAAPVGAADDVPSWLATSALQEPSEAAVVTAGGGGDDLPSQRRFRRFTRRDEA